MQTKTVTNSFCIKIPEMNHLLRSAFAFILLTLSTLISTNISAETQQQENPAIFSINNLTTKLIDNVFIADLEQEFHLNDTVIEAMQNGVPITLQTQFNIYTDHWYWNEEIVAITQRYRINYHALSQQYILTNINTGKQTSYSKLYRVLDELTTIKNLPLVDKNILPEDKELFITVRNRLEIESLPLPLKATAYLSGSWRLKSDWATWLLKD